MLKSSSAEFWLVAYISVAKQDSEVFFTDFKLLKVPYSTGGDNSNKACFGRTTKFLREYGNFAGNREARKNFGET